MIYDIYRNISTLKEVQQVASSLQSEATLLHFDSTAYNSHLSSIIFCRSARMSKSLFQKQESQE